MVTTPLPGLRLITTPGIGATYHHTPAAVTAVDCHTVGWRRSHLHAACYHTTVPPRLHTPPTPPAAWWVLPPPPTTVPRSAGSSYTTTLPLPPPTDWSYTCTAASLPAAATTALPHYVDSCLRWPLHAITLQSPRTPAPPACGHAPRTTRHYLQWTCTLPPPPTPVTLPCNTPALPTYPHLPPACTAHYLPHAATTTHRTPPLLRLRLPHWWITPLLVRRTRTLPRGWIPYCHLRYLFGLDCLQLRYDCRVDAAARLLCLLCCAPA